MPTTEATRRSPAASSYTALQTMRANRRSNTKPELLVLSTLHRRGLRFRKDFRIDLSSGGSVRPDVVFTRARVAVLIDGCFWHRCPEHFQRPRANRSFWDAKIQGSVDRDARVNEALTLDGWRVLRIWEHTPAEDAAAYVAHVLGGTTRRSDHAIIAP
jgi:DNA mismatch endonuclease, patch repair protein